MIWAGLMAALGFAAGAIALFSIGPEGMALSALALGLGLGGVASLSSGPTGFACLAGVGAVAALLIFLSGRLPWLDRSIALLGQGPVVERPRVFGIRSLRAILGAMALFTARLLSGHLTAGTVATQGPGFACLFVFEVGLIRIGTGQGPAEMGLGGLCAGMGAAAFVLLSAPGASLLVAVMACGIPALAMVALARATPWEISA
ncbi:MAG TPA: hypothetical protein VNH82_02640 [Candidatus Dormibacteraeota bacterium]|nr:hypothetical protein [Candidatus Dormibacteraeota bacterium]